MVAEVKKGSITKISGLEKRPVYFLHLKGDPNPTVVVKGESRTGQDFEDALCWGTKIMRNVNDKSVRVKVMTASEVDVFKSIAKVTFNGKVQGKSLEEIGITWIKMPYIAGLQDAETRETDDKADVSKVINRFMSKQFWYELGQIVAVDIFIGNNDRFDTKGNWVNQGNVMFAPEKKSGRDRLIGLDTFDTGGGDKAYFAKSGTTGNEIQILNDSAIRHTYAEKCTKSVGRGLCRSAKRCGAKGYYVRTPDNVASIDIDQLEKAFEKFTEPFERGIEVGASNMKKYLRGKSSMFKKNRGLPEGIAERMKALKW